MSVAPFPGRQGQVDGGDGGPYDRLDARLRAVEIEVGGIKVTMRDVATKHDIDLAVEKLKNRIMVGATIGTLAVIGWLVTWIIRLSTT